MGDFNGWLAAFRQLPAGDRQQSVELIEAYNAAVAEYRSDNTKTHLGPFRLFSRDEIERLVDDYRLNKLSIMAPAMKHYLKLLEEGFRLPASI